MPALAGHGLTWGDAPPQPQAAWLGKRYPNMGAEGWPGKRYPNMGAEGCTASATVILVLLFRAILSLVVFDCYWCRNQNILEKI